MWTNKFSGEQGYVASVPTKKGYFISTKDRDKAKVYNAESRLKSDQKFLQDIGEYNQNNFEVVTL